MRFPQYAPVLCFAAALVGCDSSSRAPLTAPDVVPAASLGGLIASAVVTLDPVVAVDLVGASRTVTATVTGAEGPVEGATVVSEITGAFGFNAPFACTTNASGQCSFSYAFESVDVHTIRSCVEGSTVGCRQGTQVWMEPSAPEKVTGGGWLFPVPDDGEETILTSAQRDEKRVTFGFTARFDDGDAEPTIALGTVRPCRARGVVQDHSTKTMIKILTCTMLEISPTHATFSGKAEVNGYEEHYTIDVDDLGEPSTPSDGLGDTFKIVTDTYSAAGPLGGGNIQIHKEQKASG